jgi:hypothetical protein
MRCPSCSFENASGIKFCGECGAPLKVKCSSCGFENAPSIKFCGECGKPLAQAAKSAPPPDPRSYTPNPDYSVRHEGAGVQQMKVLPDELSVQLRSYPSTGAEQSALAKPRRRRRAQGSLSKPAGRNASES